MDSEKIDRFVKLIGLMEACNKFPIFNELNAKAMEEAKNLAKEMNANPGTSSSAPISSTQP